MVQHTYAGENNRRKFSGIFAYCATVSSRRNRCLFAADPVDNLQETLLGLQA